MKMAINYTHSTITHLMREYPRRRLRRYPSQCLADHFVCLVVTRSEIPETLWGICRTSMGLADNLLTNNSTLSFGICNAYNSTDADSRTILRRRWFCVPGLITASCGRGFQPWQNFDDGLLRGYPFVGIDRVRRLD